MPLFEFECEQCGARAEHLVHSAEDADLTYVFCPRGCKDRFSSTARMRRVPSASSFQLRGVGWTPKHFTQK